MRKLMFAMLLSSCLASPFQADAGMVFRFNLDGLAPISGTFINISGRLVRHPNQSCEITEFEGRAFRSVLPGDFVVTRCSINGEIDEQLGQLIPRINARIDWLDPNCRIFCTSRLQFWVSDNDGIQGVTRRILDRQGDLSFETGIVDSAFVLVAEPSTSRLMIIVLVGVLLRRYMKMTHGTRATAQLGG